MKAKLMELFRLEGTVGPRTYLVTGVVAFLLKYPIDHFVAGLVAHRPWMPWQYMDPLGTTVSLLGLGSRDRQFLALMTAIALPFIWLGIAMTVKRLRSAGATAALVVLFFAPVINLILFLILSLVPPAREAVREPMGSRRGHDALAAIGMSVVICLAAVWLGTKWLGNYGLGLFVALPFCLGLISTLAYTWRTPRRYRACAGVALATCAVAGASLLFIKVEGLICLIMASPLVAALALLGAAVGYAIQVPSYTRRELAALILLLALYPPAVMGAESVSAPPEFEVHTAIDVNAPPERVWRHVVSFAQLAEPRELLFRAGIAYPIRAEIHGRGVGAVRYCVFSTGPFVEPITIWDEPRLLEFAVTRNPAPMRELSPYADLHPRHLQGFLVSHKGHFRLTALPEGRTRLEGVTWYVHSLWPSGYWRLWSDFIIHRIHVRVLEQVKAEAERG